MVRRPRGFTLLELMTGGAVALIVLAGAFATFVHTTALQRRQMELAAMKRGAALVLGQLGAELRQAGLGRPRHARAEGNNALFPPAISLAAAQQLAFYTDLPREDSSFNGFSLLADDQSTGLPANGIALLNELNGGCDITAASPHCTSDAESLLFPASPGSDCASNPTSSRTCPWSLNRYRGNEYLIVADAKGRWVERRLQAPPFATVTGGRSALVLQTPLPTDLLTGSNRGFVSTQDRVCYMPVYDSVQRNQCWGSVFTAGGAFFMDCSACGSDSTGWEILTTGMATNGLRFTYWDAHGVKLIPPITDEASLRRIRRVDVELTLSRTLPGGEVLSHSSSLSITLRQ